MQVSVEQLEGLERRMTVQVPADAVEQKVQSRLQSLTHKARIDGFRPGKVPMKIIKRMYGAQVRQEVLGEVMEQSFQDALVEQQLRPAGGPKVEPLKIEEGQDFEYAATFEVFPDFTPSGIEGQKITRPVAEVADIDIDKMIENLRKQRANWVSVERPAQENDRVTISFEGTLDGEGFPGGKGENTEVVLGEGRMIAEFEQKLHGLSANTESEFEVQFPADYHSGYLAGKTVQFKVQVHKVEESELPEVDEAFVQAFGIEDGSIDGLRTALRQNMERELQDGVKSYIKNQVMDALLQVNKFPVPQALIDSEVETLAKQAGFPEQDDADTKAFKAKMFEDAAKRRVVLQGDGTGAEFDSGTIGWRCPCGRLGPVDALFPCGFLWSLQPGLHTPAFHPHFYLEPFAILEELAARACDALEAACRPGAGIGDGVPDLHLNAIGTVRR